MLKSMLREEMKNGRNIGIFKSFNHFKIFPHQLSHIFIHLFTQSFNRQPLAHTLCQNQRQAFGGRDLKNLLLCFKKLQ